MGTGYVSRRRSFSSPGGARDRPFLAGERATLCGGHAGCGAWTGVEFSLPDGGLWRTSMINLPVFPFRTPEAFYKQILAMKA